MHAYPSNRTTSTTKLYNQFMLPTWVLLHTCWHAAFLIHNNLLYILIVYDNNNSIYIGVWGWGQWHNYYGLGPGEPEGPQPQWAKWGPQAVEQKHWPGLLICHNVIFWPSEFSKISPQSPWNDISESIRKLLRKLVYLALLLGGALEIVEPGAPWYNVTPLLGGGGVATPQVVWQTRPVGQYLLHSQAILAYYKNK
jgi:hypothetical protein